MTIKFGVDVGGTKISAIALGPDGAVLFHDRRPTPQGDYGATVQAISQLIGDASAASGVKPDCVGAGIPGAMAADNRTVKNANSQVLIGKPLKADLEAALSCPVAISNDANCFAVSEATDGAAAGAGVVFGVILGTGVGGGIAINGNAHDGVNRLAGEWGHNPFPFAKESASRRPCYCGKTGCIETVLSGPALAQNYADAGGDGVSAAEIADRAMGGEALAVSVIEAYTENLARSLAEIINLLDPDVIVLGGGVSSIDAIYPAARTKVLEHIFNAAPGPASLATRIVKNKWGDDSGVRGAAQLSA